MGKALLGTYAVPSSLRLLDEVQALRRRVADLERALAAAEDVRDAREARTASSLEAEQREPAAT
jgi:hypothetical protein